MEKLKILFDSTILSAVNQKDEARGGIFFVAYNIFKKFAQDNLFDITLYLEKSSYLNLIKSDQFLSTFKTVCANYVLGNSGENKLVKNTKFNPQDYDLYFSADFSSKLDDNKIEHFHILHDVIPLIYPQIFTGGGRLMFFKHYNDVLNYNTNCFCVSQDAKLGFLRFFPILDENKMIVTPNGASMELTVQKDPIKLQKVLEKYNIHSKNKYILTFNAIAQRKNTPFTLSCYLKFIEKNKIDDLNFYLAGSGSPDGLISQLDSEACALYQKHKDKVVFLGYVDDEDVNIFYSNCLFFMFLSLYEGFGMPVLEAMMSGAPIIVSNTSSLPEVAGDCAIAINPRNQNECILAMEKLYADENLRNDLIQKGLKRAQLFSWDKTYSKIRTRILEVMERKASSINE